MVTNKTDNPVTGETQGIQDNILQPGIYFLNPEEKRVDVISIGFNETTQMVQTKEGSSNLNNRLGKAPGKDPEYVPGTGIEFPSNNGFPIHLDYTAIWGILPDQAPDVVRQFGTLKDVEQKVILPRSARSAGSTAPSEAPSTSWSATPARSSRPTPPRNWSGSWPRRT